jgi:dipeptidyl aminopeptidase/acylaminoacyl peptidase
MTVRNHMRGASCVGESHGLRAAGVPTGFLTFSSRSLVVLFGVLSLASAAPGADEVIAPNQALVAEGLPAIPKTLAERAGPYMEFRSASFLDWNPLRQEILISTRFADAPQLHRVKMPGGARTQITFYPERVGFARFRPGSADIVFSKDIGGGEWFQLYLREDKSGRITMFTDGKSRNTGGVFTRDGRWLAYESTKRDGKDNDIYVIDPSDPKSERLLLQVDGGGWFASDWSPDGKTILVVEAISANESRYYLVDAATGAKTLFTPETKEKVAYGRARFSRDGKIVYVTSDKDSEFHRLVAIDRTTKRWDVLTPDVSWDVSGFDLSDDGTKIAYVLNESGAETMHALDLKTRREIPLPKLPLGTLGGVKWCPASRNIGFTLTSARSPADAYSIDTMTGKLERWTESETGGLDASTFSEPESISWKSFDGRTITGFLYRPPASFTGPRPVVVNIHGGPEAQYQPGFLGRYNYLLSELGIAMIFPNVRGSSGFGKTFLTLDNAEKREDSVKDIGSLLEWIASQPRLDRSRVMVTGGSYGGYMTLASMTHYNDRFRCAVEVVGISNWVTFLEHTEAYRRDLRRVEYGDERDPKMREILLKMSPLTSAANITKPMFIVQGLNDPRVPHTEAEQMVAAIKKNGGPVWFLMARDEGHGFSKKKNQDFQFYATLKFMEDYLLK